MGRERLEEGLLPRSSLAEPRPVFHGIDDVGGGDSSATPVVIFSTLVAMMPSAVHFVPVLLSCYRFWFLLLENYL
ncbi:hypothetical protein ACOSQ3_015126 [Xanthoceras sorbifolium]